MNARFTVVEIRRILRQPPFLIFAVGLPALMFLVISGLYGSKQAGGIEAVKYVMASMAAFGAMSAAINIGGQVATERSTGWNRLLRLTPLQPWSYVLTKLLVSVLLALPAILAVYALGALAKGVRMPAQVWLESGLSLWLGALPFGVLGLVVGYLAKPQTAGVIISGVFFALSLFGGLWFPVEIMPAFMAFGAKLMPSYWLGELARGPLDDGAVSVQAVLTMAVWTVALGLLAMWAYRRDTSRA